jgi:surface polysaccharide O-acyltransferase-like enzyme
MNKNTSNKIKIVSLILMILVLFIHSYNLNSGSNYSCFVYFIEFIGSYFLASFAVPFFFVISGFFIFFQKSFTLNNFRVLLKKRFNSLVVPYFFWTLFWTLIFFVSSKMFPFFNGNEVLSFSFKTFWNPINYQFWFIRDLIILVVVSPLLYYLCEKSIMLLFLPYLFLIFKIDFGDFQIQSLLYFWIGIAIAQHQNQFKQVLYKTPLGLVAFIWILFFFFHFHYNQATFFGYKIYKIAYFASAPFGIVTFWKVLDLLINDYSKSWILHFASYSFFIFAFHEPVLVLLKKIGFKLFGNTNITALLFYFLLPIFIIFISIILAKIIQKITPKFYLFITGGRI